MYKRLLVEFIIFIGIVIVAGIMIALIEPSAYTVTSGGSSRYSNLSWWQTWIIGILLLYGGVRAAWAVITKKKKENTKRKL